MHAIVGVDAHKGTHTLVVVDALGRKIGQNTIATTTEAHQEGLRWARARFGTDLVWGVEDCRTLTARLERDLLAAGQRVVRVPPHLMSRASASARERGKSDPIDALAVARTVLREPELPVASHNPLSIELRLLVDRREDLIRQRTATINRLLGHVHQLDPQWAKPRNWNSKKPPEQLGAWLGTQQGLLAELACDEFDEVVELSEKAGLLARRIGQRVRQAAPALLTVQGCGELTAAKIVAEVAGIERFKTEAAFARHVGVAPIPHWSGQSRKPLRPIKHGNRQLNTALHRIAMVQITHDGPGRAYYYRRLDEGDSRQRALRSLKRRLARTVFNRIRADADGRHAMSRPTPPSVLMLPLADLEVGRQRRASADGAQHAYSRRPGRPRALDPYQERLARRMHASGDKVAVIAAALTVSASTISRVLSDGGCEISRTNKDVNGG